MLKHIIIEGFYVTHIESRPCSLWIQFYINDTRSGVADPVPFGLES